jgi:hypothetical protein
MRGRGVDDEVRRFIERTIDSALELEVLLQLHSYGSAITAAEVASVLRFDAHQTEATLEALVDAGAVVVGTQPGFYALQPGRKNRSAVDALARAYDTHRVAVIEAIFSKPSEAVRGFAAAFRIRDDEDDADG